MNDRRRAPEAILFDLFGTLVFVDASRLPRVTLSGERRMLTIAGLEDLLLERAPGITVETFLERLRDVSIAIAEETARTNRELPSRERFRRTLAALEVQSDVDATAEELSLRHMDGLASAVVCPSDRVQMLEALSERYRLALVSNFDHGPTARAILERDGLLAHFDAVVISDEAGIRKPATEIFHAASSAVAVDAADCIHVGDSHRADVEGAKSAGMRAVWIRGADDPDSKHAEATIDDVCQLPSWLDGIERSG